MGSSLTSPACSIHLQNKHSTAIGSKGILHGLREGGGGGAKYATLM